ncbi:hypothetical protein [Aliihoeflea sp. 2WW]|uniref:hypothetical protein n=1 Tax=Aliihoeflea sp. 2WW TaxID=1381123 RepID=UPI0004675408|nr:hypothetical protein [Aliihoeflea sp. 2WW]
MSEAGDSRPLETPDGRYIVVNGRLWRKSNPTLTPVERQQFTQDLMAACRDVGQGQRSGDQDAVRAARARVDEAKVALGERGPVWWDDGAPDYGRKLAKNTPYAEWFAEVKEGV